MMLYFGVVNALVSANVSVGNMSVFNIGISQISDLRSLDTYANSLCVIAAAYWQLYYAYNCRWQHSMTILCEVCHVDAGHVTWFVFVG